MMLDHSAASVLLLMIKSGMLDVKTWAPVYEIMRGIGRIAFPIFCFLLAEGFRHTKNKAKYLGRLFLFALISELPFDLALRGTLVDMEHQNVFFTLFLGMGVLCILEALRERIQNDVIYYITSVIAVLFGMGISEFLHTDYHMFGVLIIVLFYVFYRTRVVACAMGLLVLISCFGNELPSLLAFPLLLLYNGRRGRGMKYFFYVFYPAHLLLLFAVGSCMGLYNVLL